MTLLKQIESLVMQSTTGMTDDKGNYVQVSSEEALEKIKNLLGVSALEAENKKLKEKSKLLEHFNHHIKQANKDLEDQNIENMKFISEQGKLLSQTVIENKQFKYENEKLKNAFDELRRGSFVPSYNNFWKTPEYFPICSAEVEHIVKFIKNVMDDIDKKEKSNEYD